MYEIDIAMYHLCQTKPLQFWREVTGVLLLNRFSTSIFGPVEHLFESVISNLIQFSTNGKLNG